MIGFLATLVIILLWFWVWQPGARAAVKNYFQTRAFKKGFKKDLRKMRVHD